MEELMNDPLFSWIQSAVRQLFKKTQKGARAFADSGGVDPKSSLARRLELGGLANELFNGRLPEDVKLGILDRHSDVEGEPVTIWVPVKHGEEEERNVEILFIVSAGDRRGPPRHRRRLWLCRDRARRTGVDEVEDELIFWVPDSPTTGRKATPFERLILLFFAGGLS
jgi:hypothetical protein